MNREGGPLTSENTQFLPQAYWFPTQVVPVDRGHILVLR